MSVILAVVGVVVPLVLSSAASAASAPTTLVLTNQLSSVTGLPVLYPGHNEHYILAVTNNGPTMVLDGAKIIDNVPPMLGVVSPATISTMPPGASGSCTTVGQKVECDINNLAVGDVLVITIPVSVPISTTIGSNISNRADLTALQMPGVQAVISSNDVGPFPIDLKVTVGGIDLAAGASGTIPVIVTNLTVGETTLVPVTTRIMLPSATAIALIPPAGCTPVTSPPASTVAWDCTTSSPLAPNTPVRFDFGVSGAAAASASQTATVTASIQPNISLYDAVVSNNTASSLVRVGPRAVNDLVSTTPGVAVNTSVLANDQVANGATFVKTSDTTHGTLVFNPDGTFTYTPNAGYSGTDVYTYSVTNPGMLSFPATATVNIVVRPGAVDDSVSVNYGQVAAGAVSPNDIFAVGAVFTVVTPPGHGTFLLNPNGTFSFTPDPTFSGIVEAVYQVKNPDGSATTAKLTIHVGPKAKGDSVRVEPGVSTNGNVASTDIYGQGAVFTKTGEPAHGTATIQPDGSYTYTPKPGYSGPDSVPYIIRNPDGLTSSSFINIQVRPKANDDNFVVTYPGPLVCDLKSNDVFAVGATFSITTQPAHGTVTITADGSCLYTPGDPKYSGPDSFTYTVRNPDGSSSTATVIIQLRRGGSLPATGAPSRPVAIVALGLLMVGILLCGLSRRLTLIRVTSR